MATAHKRDAVLKDKFWFRKHMADPENDESSDDQEAELMTVGALSLPLPLPLPLPPLPFSLPSNPSPLLSMLPLSLLLASFLEVQEALTSCLSSPACLCSSSPSSLSPPSDF